MTRRARDFGASDDMARYAMIRGLRQQLRPYVLQQNPSTLAAFLEAAQVAEATIGDTTEPTSTAEILEAIRRLEMRSTASVDRAPRERSTSPFGRRRQSASRPDDRRVRFADQPQARSSSTGPAQQHFARPPASWSDRDPSPARLQRNDRQSFAATTVQSRCGNCGRVHQRGQCFAFGQTCRACGKANHFQRCCRSRRQQRLE